MGDFLKSLPLALGLPVVIGAASVRPDDAASNLAAWAKLLGIEHAPAWLSNPAIDNRVIVGSLVLSALYAFLVWGVPAIRRRSEERTQATQTRIQIIIGTGHPFETIAPAGVNRRRILRVEINNSTDTDITDGRLEALNLDPPHRGNAHWLLKSEIQIAARKSKLVDVACYDEGSSEAKPGTWMQLIVPAGGAFFAEALPLLPPTPHTFQLKFLSQECGLFDQVACRLYVDTDRILHLENQISPQSKVAFSNRISLHEAASRAYEALQYHDSVIPMEAFTNSPSEILINVCEMLCRAQKTPKPLVKLYGNKPPSRLQEEIYMAPLNKYEFIVDGNSIVLVGHNGSVHYENLVVDPDQVEAAIADIKQRHEALTTICGK